MSKKPWIQPDDVTKIYALKKVHVKSKENFKSEWPLDISIEKSLS
jgi:hypothetical protein